MEGDKKTESQSAETATQLEDIEAATGEVTNSEDKAFTLGSNPVVVEKQPSIMSDNAAMEGRVEDMDGALIGTDDQQGGQEMDCEAQRPAIISLVLQSEGGQQIEIPSSQDGEATTSGLTATEVGKGVLDDGETLESVQFVEASPSTLLQCKDVEDTVVTDGQAIHLDDGTTAYIHQVSADKFTSIEDGQTVQLGDGSTAYILRASLKGEGSNLQAVQLEDGTTALLQTNFDSSQDDAEGGGSLTVLDPFPEGTDAVSQPTAINVSGTSTVSTTGSVLQLKTNEAGALTIKGVTASADVFGKDFRCTYSGCGRYYTSAHHLKVHIRSHTGERPYQCSHCEKAFATSYGLKSHTRVHTGEKPYRCPFANCAKAFKTSGDLQKHIRTHTGERPFKCPFEGCEKSFTTSNIRKVHIRTHTGERPYVCQHEGCVRAFSSATNFKNHMRIHSGEKPYVCTVSGCGKRFTEYSSLYKHHVVHTYSKPYTCVICGKNYRQTSTLCLHRRTAHGIMDDEMPPTQVPLTRPGRSVLSDGSKQQWVDLQIREQQPEANTILVSTTASELGAAASSLDNADTSNYVTVISDPSVQQTTTTSEDISLGNSIVLSTTDSSSTNLETTNQMTAVTSVEAERGFDAIKGLQEPTQELPPVLVENAISTVTTAS